MRSRSASPQSTRPIAYPLFGDSAACHQGAELLKALAHPLRLRIVARLAASPATVGALAEELGVAQAIVSQQLAVLRARNLAGPVRAGERGPYRIRNKRVRHMLNCLHGCILERMREARP